MSKKKIEIEKFNSKKEVLTEIPSEEIDIIEKEILRQKPGRYPRTHLGSDGFPVLVEEIYVGQVY